VGDGSESTQRDLLDVAREAAARGSWFEARQALVAADDAGPLEPEDLELLAKASWWTAHSDGSIAARERAYAAYLERGDVERAAFCALTLRREHATKLQGSTAKGWLSRAERLLADRPESATHGYLAIAHAERAWSDGELRDALDHLGRAHDIASRSPDPDLHAWASMRQGQVLVADGDLEGGWDLLEEVSVAAVGGELGAYTTGAVFCNVIETSRELADYRRGREWSDAATRWCDRQSISGFPGICRVRKAEVLRLMGSFEEAESEVRRACDELPEFSPYFASEAYHELGEVLLRMGELDRAEDALRRAKELGADPQPALALLQLARGTPDAAAASIRRTLDETGWDRLARARLLPASVEIAFERGDVETIRAGAQELAELADEFPTAAIRANAEMANATLDLVLGDADPAVPRLRSAMQLWREIDAAYDAARVGARLAEAMSAQGDADGARLELQTAVSTFRRLGAPIDERHGTERLAALAAPVVDRPRAVAIRTFVFTDIVGSTSLLQAIGDEAWSDLRRWHDETLRACVSRHEGQEVDHTGDGFFIAFPDPASAVACAVEIQQVLAEHRRTHGFAPQVRIGLHAAEATVVGEAYAGLGVHTAARVGAIAGGDEIVATASTAELVGGLDALDPRAVELKGIAEPVLVVTIAWR
jgi:class 3 adenylate cyclase